MYGKDNEICKKLIHKPKSSGLLILDDIIIIIILNE